MVSGLGLKRRYLLVLLAALFAAACPIVSASAGQEQQGSELFDGAGNYGSLSETGASAGMPRETLKEALRQRIAFDDHGSEKERAGYERLLSKLMESPTARAEAEKFVNSDFQIKFSYVEMPSSYVASVNGRKEVRGDRGVTYTNKVPPEVQLNMSFLDCDVETGVETFAHETFGHSVSASTLTGENRSINRYAVTEEENARLIGWLVGAELRTPNDQEVWNYAANPDEAVGALAMVHPTYALKLTTSEMADPLPVYRERLAKAEELLANIPKQEGYVRDWDKIVDHFVKDHKIEESSFKSIRESLDNSRKSLPKRKQTLLKVKEALTERMAYFSSEEGKATLELLKKGSSAEFLRERDAEILANRKKLEGLLSGTTQQSSQPPPIAGQITWDQLKVMLEKDRESCEFGGVK